MWYINLPTEDFKTATPRTNLTHLKKAKAEINMKIFNKNSIGNKITSMVIFL